MRRSRTAFALGVVVPLLMVGGCSDDDPEPRIAPTRSASPSDTGSPSSTPSGPVEPIMPGIARRHSAAGAEAFVTFYWEMVNYAQATGDVAGLRNTALPGCDACKGGADGISATYGAGGSIEGGEVTVTSARSKRLFVAGRTIFQVSTAISTTPEVIRTPGERNKRYPAGSSELRFIVQHSDAGWLVGRWDVIS